MAKQQQIGDFFGIPETVEHYFRGYSFFISDDVNFDTGLSYFTTTIRFT